MTAFWSWSSKKESIQKKLTFKIHIIYGLSCVLNIVDVIENK